MFATVTSGFLSRRGVLPFVILALVAILSTSAIAQTPGDSPGKRLEAIRAQMDKGQGLYVAGNYSGAAELFEAGYTTYPYSAFLFNAGVCYQKQNDVEHALAKFKEYLKADPSAPDADKVIARIAATSKFGAAVAVGSLDGNGDGEVIVGAPEMTVRGESGAGAVLVFDDEKPSDALFVDAKFLSSAKSGDGLCISRDPPMSTDVTSSP